MIKMIAGCAAALLAALPMRSAWSDATSFRGLELGMTTDEAIAALDSEIDGRHSKTEAGTIVIEGITLSRSGKYCGTADIMKDRVVKLSLKRCYFGADDLPVGDIAQQMVNAYAIPEMAWEAPCRTVIKNQQTYDNPPIYGCYVGATMNQELVIIEGDGNLLLGGGIFITEQTATPSFN